MIEWNAAPIPSLRTVTGFQDRPIQECGQKLIALNGLHPRIKTRPMYHLQGIPGARPILFAREEVVQRLIHALEDMPQACELLVWDAWRPLEVQRWLFDQYKDKLKDDLTALGQSVTEMELQRRTARFVSVPSRNPNAPSAHSTGGSVDLTLVCNGQVVNLGTDFDDFSDRAATRFFEDNEVNEEEAQVRDARRYLYRAMTNAGFTNYEAEWWHYDFGNQFYAQMTDTVAKYGYIEPDERNQVEGGIV